MQGVWTITYGGTEQSCAAWGLTAKPKIKTHDRSPTQFSFCMAGAAPEAAVPFNSYIALLNAGHTVSYAETNSRVVIKQNRTFSGGAWTGSGYVFTGYLANQPADVDGKSQSVKLVFKDAIWLMQNTTFQQPWVQASTPGSPWLVSRAILFMDISSWIPNQYQSVQWQVNQIISYAASCGIAISAGTIDYSGWYLNYCHCQAVSCWDALLKCLAPIPDAKVWVDGSYSTPKLNIRTRANIAAMSTPSGTGPGPITLPYKGTDSAGRKHFSSKSFTPRYDLVPPQVVLQYQINNTYNGKPAPSWTNDVYPATVGGSSTGQMPFALVCPIDLTGSATTTVTATLDCEPLACVGGTHAAKRAWWASHRGGMQHKLADFHVRFGTNTLPDATYYDETGAAVALDGSGNPLIAGVSYPNRIVQGTYHLWMKSGSTQIKAVRLRVTVKAQYSEWDVAGSTPAETDTNGNQTRKTGSHDLHFDITVTNAPAGVTPFVGSQLTALAESPVSNLAQNIYNSRVTLDYDGQHEIVDPGLPNASTPTPPLAQIIGHWNVLNFSGGASAWASANMTVAGTEIDLMNNHVQIEVGPSKHLQPQDWNSMLQYFRYRWLFISSSVRATGYGDGNNTVDMARNTPDANTVPGLAVDSFQSLIGADAVDATRTNVIKQDATVAQLQVVQQKTSDNTVYTAGVIAPEYSGSGAPSSTTLVTNAYYRVGDKYVDTSASALYRCTTAGDKTSSVWAKLGGSPGGNWNYRGMWSAMPSSPYMTFDVVQLGSGTAAGMYLSTIDSNPNSPDSGIGWNQVSSSSGTWL